MLIRALLGLAACVVVSSVAAQTAFRTIPADAKPGQLSHVRENILSLDGRQIQLAPGGQIRGANNLIMLPTTLPPDSLVKYQLDASGQLTRAWILTPEEAAKVDRTSPGGGIPIEQVLPKYEPERPLRFGEKPAPPPPPPPSGQN
jgi:hypothetical protein